MTPAQLIGTANKAGVELFLRDGGLVMRGDSDAVNHYRVVIAAARNDIAALLAEQHAATASDAVLVAERIVRVALDALHWRPSRQS